MKMIRRFSRSHRFLLYAFLLIAIIPTAIFIAKNPLGVKADSFLKFDEGGGSTVKDAQNNTTGTITNAQWRAEEFCVAGKCLFFDGTGDYVSFGDDSDFDFAAATNWTISLWFRHAPKTSGTDVLVAKTNSSGGYKILMESDGDITFGIDDDSTWNPDDAATSTAATYDDNQWHHIAAVKTGTTKIELFIDGVLVGSDSSIAATGTLVNSTNLYVGIDGDGSSNPYTGFIDEMNVYTTTARTSDQVKSDMIKGAGDSGSTAVFGASANSTLTNGLIGYWPMDEGSANTCTGGTNDNCDKSGNAKDGAWTGTATTGAGKFGNGVVLDGDSDYVSMGDQSIHDLSVPFSIFTWIKMDQLPSTAAHDYEIINKYNVGGSRQWTFAIGSDDSLYFWPSYNGTNGQYVFDNGYIFTSSDVGVWRQVGVTIDATGKANLYVDGVIVDTGTLNNLSIYNGASVNLRIGARGSNANYFDGTIDEARLYNRVLSPAEVKQLYEYVPSSIGHWKLDEGSGTSAYDTSGINNVGTLTGGPLWSTGKFGQAVNFDGSNDYISIPYSALQDPSVNLSIGFWFKPSTTINSGIAANLGLLSKANTNTDANNDWVFFWNSADSGRLRFGTYGDNIATTTSTWTANTWYRVDVVVTNTNTANIYINGILDTYNSDSNISSDPINGNQNTALNLGLSRVDSGDLYFNGVIDDFKLYNYARTTAQIISDMNGGHPTPGSPVGSALGHWDMDEGKGDTINDRGLGANNGDLNGTCPGGGACPSWSTAGKFGSALSFDGGDNVSTATSANLTLGKVDFTVSAWFKYTSTTFCTPMAWRSTDASGGGLTKVQGLFTISRATTDGKLGFETWAWQDSGTRLSSSNALNDGNWHMATAVYTLSDNTVRLYIDGVLHDSKNQGTTYNPTTSQNFHIIMGSNIGSVQYCTGSMDDAYIYNQALAADQIKTLYNHGVSQSMGSVSTNSSGSADNSQARSYCPPGNSETNCGGSNNPTPASHWKLDENTSTTAFDKSGNGNDLTLTNSPKWITGKYSAGIGFTGNNQHLTRADDADFDFADDESLSISTWFKHPTASSQEVILSKYNEAGYKIIMEADGDITCAMDYDSTWTPTDFATSTAATYDDNQWHHIACVKNAASSLTLYIDGRLITTDSSITATNTLTNSDPLYLGIDADGSSNDFTGSLDDTKIFRYVLTPAQVAWDYNQGKPLARWEMDEASWNNNCSTDTVFESSGNNFHMDSCPSSTGPTGGTAAKYGNGGTFDGTNDYLETPDHSSLSFTSSSSQFSFAAWIYLNSSATNDRAIISKYDSQNSEIEYSFFVDATNRELNFFTSGDGSPDIFAEANWKSSSPNNILAYDQWQHVVVTVNLSTDTVTYYVNGKSYAGENDQLTGITDIPNLTEPVRIGAMRCGTGSICNYWSGQLDDIRIYNYALSREQIQTIINNSSTVKF